jgi:uncharacterized protein YdaU (DUF1376 family)
MLEHAAYTLLLDALYASEELLPTDEKSLYRICGASNQHERKAVKSILTQFFFKKLCSNGEGYSNKRYEEELKHLESKTLAAKIGADARWKKDANALQTHSGRIATPDSRLQTPDFKPKLNITHAPGVAFTEVEEYARAQFEIFWLPYPNKIDRDQAFFEWLAMSPIDQNKAAESIPKWVLCDQWQDPRYVPSAVKFLKNRRWEVAPAKKGGNGVTKTAVAKLRGEIESGRMDRPPKFPLQ